MSNSSFGSTVPLDDVTNLINLDKEYLRKSFSVTLGEFFKESKRSIYAFN